MTDDTKLKHIWKGLVRLCNSRGYTVTRGVPHNAMLMGVRGQTSTDGTNIVMIGTETPTHQAPLDAVMFAEMFGWPVEEMIETKDGSDVHEAFGLYPMSNAEQVEVLAHETAHVLLHDGMSPGDLARDRAELEAEVTAQWLMRDLGIPIDPNVAPLEVYVKGWTEKVDPLSGRKGRGADYIWQTGSEARVKEALDTELRAVRAQFSSN